MSLKVFSKIPGEVEDRIVALSLRNPDLGARRLLPLLQQDNISVSPSTVYNILKRKGLQTREKRLAKLDKTSIKPAPISQKSFTRIPLEVKERIVEVSLQHPDHGARRLVPLLKQQGIQVSVSSVYTILRRRGLQTHEKRFLALLSQDAVEIPSAPAIVIPTPVKETAAEDIEEKVPPPRVSLAPKAAVKRRMKRPWFLTFVNILLAVLLVSWGIYAVQKMSRAWRNPHGVFAVEPVMVRNSIEMESSARPLADYRIIWERNLFDSSKQKLQTPKKNIVLDTIATADKELGLRLIGTVVTDDPTKNLAIIYNTDTRQQDPYHEGDAAGEVLIKKVLRENVLITTKHGDKLLTVEIEQTRQPSKTYKMGQLKSTSSIRLDRAEVESPLDDIDQLLEKVTILPFKQDGQAAGFRLSKLPPKNILRKMGLRLRDVIVGVNGEAITDPDQASYVFQKLAQGGEVTLEIKRRGLARRIQLDIE
jgi:general secretion pathway protein C